jgi:hypothetical protein
VKYASDGRQTAGVRLQPTQQRILKWKNSSLGSTFEIQAPCSGSSFQKMNPIPVEIRNYRSASWTIIVEIAFHRFLLTNMELIFLFLMSLMVTRSDIFGSSSGKVSLT